MFMVIILPSLVLVVFSFLPAARVLIARELYGILVTDIIFILATFVIFFFPRIAFRVRAWLLIFSFYLIGAMLLFSVGTITGGHMWLLSSSIMAGLMLSFPALVLTVVLNALALVCIGSMLYWGGLSWPVENINEWVAAGGNFLFLNIITSLSVGFLLRGFLRVFHGEQRANAALHSEKSLTDKTNLHLSREIEERKKSEEKLQASEARYRLLAENASDIIWTLSLDSLRFTYLSPSVERITGYTVDECLQLDLEDILAPGSLERIMEQLAEELEKDRGEGADKNRIVETEIQQIRKDGSYVWTEISVRFIRDDNGNPVGVLGMTRDISERKKIEEEKENLIDELKLALKEIKTLRGIVPICAKCKKIRGDQGYWQQVEQYIQEHSEAKFSHSICPDCLKEVYPELADDMIDLDF